MFLKYFLILVDVCTASDMLFPEILKRIESKIDSQNLKRSLKIAHVDDVNEDEAKLIMVIFIYCEKKFQKSSLTLHDVYNLISTTKDASRLLLISDKLKKFRVSKFLCQPFAKKCNLPVTVKYFAILIKKFIRFLHFIKRI